VIDGESEDDNCDEVICTGWGEPGGQWAEWGWRNEEGSWFHRWGDAYVKLITVRLNEGGWSSVLTATDLGSVGQSWLWESHSLTVRRLMRWVASLHCETIETRARRRHAVTGATWPTCRLLGRPL